MTKLRLRYNQDINIVDSNLGITNTSPEEKLQINGTVLGNFNVLENTTFKEVYNGFISQKQNVSLESTITFTNTFGIINEKETANVNLDSGFTTLSEDIIVDEGSVLEISERDNKNDNCLLSVGTLESVSIQSHFSVPHGGSNDRKDNPIEGTVRFNTDLATLEFFNGNEWKQFTYNQGQSGRAVFGGGNNPTINPTTRNDIDFVNIHTLGNAQDFGDLTLARNNITGCSSGIRGIFGQGDTPTYQDTIDYITIASQGNAIDFGNISTTNRSYASGCSSSTRGLFNGGYTTSPSNQTVNIIDRLEISTLGDAVDFGDLLYSTYAAASTSSTTRAIVAGGVGAVGQIQKYEIGSGGTSIDFGQLSESRWSINGMSNGTRGVFGGGQKPVHLRLIEFVNISSEGNAIQFGDLSADKQGVGHASSKTRGLFHSGRTTSNPQPNTIEYINMSSLGDAIDFGDATVGRSRMAGFSDSHGGLGGF